MDDLAFRQFMDAVREYVRGEIRRSDQFRRLLRELTAWLASELEACPPQEAGPPATAAAAEPGAAPRAAAAGAAAHTAAPAPAPAAGPGAAEPSAAAPAAAGPSSAATVTLRLGDASTRIRVAGTTREIGRARAAAEEEKRDEAGLVHPLLEEGARVDLALIERRCLLKADSCRLFIERRAAAGDPLREPALVDRVAGLLARARALPDCFLWVLWRERSQPADADLLVIARCYEAVAAAASLMAFCDGSGTAAAPQDAEDAMQLLAEAGSALRVVLRATWLSSPDVDQDDVHAWLSRETAVRRILIGRYMRLDDPADPAAADRVIADVGALRERVAEQTAAQKKVANLLGKLRYHARQFVGGAPDPHDAQRIGDAVEALVALGVPASDRRVMEALRAIDPGALPPGIGLGPAVWAALEALARDGGPRGDTAAAAAEQAERDWSGAVLEVRDRLAGTCVVIVGGERRSEAADRIREAFALADLEWVRLTEHGSGAAMRAPIERLETSLVLVLVKLAGHLHAEEASDYARRAGKPCVFLKAGYNPEQIADAVLKQARVQLAARA